MANGQTQLQRSLQTSGQGFDAVLNSVMGVFSQLKKVQTEKQKMKEQLEARKDLIEFRSDVQVEQQKRVFEEIEKPQIQVERQQQLLEERRQALEDAEQTRKSLIQEYTKPRYKSVSKYNLLNPDFRIQTEEKDGKIVGYRPQVLVGEEKQFEVPQIEFREELSKRAGFGDFLSGLEQKKQEGELGQSQRKVVEIDGEDFDFSTIGSDNLNEQITRIKQDPQYREFMYELYSRVSEGALYSQKAPEQESSEESGGRKTTPLNEYIGLAGRVREITKNGLKRYELVDSGFLGFGEDTTGFQVDFKTSIAGVQSQINEGIRQNFFPDDQDFDLGKLSVDARKAIISGNVDALESNLEGNVEEWATTLAEQTEANKQQIDELVDLYNFYEIAYNEGFARLAQGKPGEGPFRTPSEVALDLNRMPSNVDRLSDFRKMFVDISKEKNRSRLNSFIESFRGDTKPAIDIFKN